MLHIVECVISLYKCFECFTLCVLLGTPSLVRNLRFVDGVSYNTVASATDTLTKTDNFDPTRLRNIPCNEDADDNDDPEWFGSKPSRNSKSAPCMSGNSGWGLAKHCPTLMSHNTLLK